MPTSKNSENSDYVGTPSTKRDSNVISPHDKDNKKSKMAEKEMPEWAKNLACASDLKEIMNKLDTFQEKIISRVDKLESEVLAVPEKIQKLESGFQDSLDFHANNISKVDKRVDGLIKQNEELTQKVSNLQDIVIKSVREKNELKQKVTELEDRQRRDNLVIEGLEDTEKESAKMCENKARSFMKNDLKMNNADKVVIGRVHRMGRYSADKPRATIIKFDRYKEREAVWQRRSKVPNGKRLKENFSRQTERDRSKLFPIMKAARNHGYFSKLEGNRLIVSKSDENVHLSVTVDTLSDLPADLQPDKLFTPSKDGVTLFYSRYSPHSNFHKCQFVEGGKEFTSVEQYLVYHNALSAGNTSVANKVLNLEDPAQIKSLGKDLVVDYDTKKEHMRKGMMLKYGQNQDLQDLLKDTGNNKLGEANPHDSYWGIGLKMSDKDAFSVAKWKDNWTGRILEEVRDELWSTL